jgi:hypothetical protein
LDPSNGTNIDQIYTVTDSLTLNTTGWFNTSVNTNDLATGSYIVQVNTGTEYYTGIMSWYGADIDSTLTDEIILHRASAGTNIDQLYTATDAALVVTTSWVSTSVNFAELVTGSYMVQVNTGTEYYTGIMSWYGADITSVATDEIILHRASSGSETSNLFLKVERTDTDLDPAGAVSPNMTLQISSSATRTAASYTYKFRRMI